MFGCRVAAFVAFGLAIYVDVGFASRVDDGAFPTTLHKGRCHVFKGLSCSISFVLLEGSGAPKITSSNCMHESTADAKPSKFVEGVQIGVVGVFDATEERQPTMPAAISLLMCAFGDPSFPGHFCASDAIQEVISGGGSTSLIWEDDREG